MPRIAATADLPELTRELAEFAGFCPDQSQPLQIANSLRKIIVDHREAKSLRFYPTREIAACFGVSLRTANLAFRILVDEGLLVTQRGSHCRVPGLDSWANHHIRGVIGLPLWAFAMRYSHLHKMMPLLLAERLWRQNLVLQSILYSEVGDVQENFDQLLMRQRMDFTLWIYPFLHNRNSIQKLQDRGIPQFVMRHLADPNVVQPDMLVSPDKAWAQVFQKWKDQRRIRTIIVPLASEYQRGREAYFIKQAQAAGFTCETHRWNDDIGPQLLRRAETQSQTLGIALLDEHSTAEFCFFNPEASKLFFRDHRVLFASNTINIPHVPSEAYTVERVFLRPEVISDALEKIILQKLYRTKERQAIRLDESTDLDWPLYRYL